MATLAAAAIIAAGTVEAGTAAAIALTIAAAVADLAIAGGTAAAARRKAKEKARNAQLQKDVTVRSGVAPRQIIYGRARVSGPIVYANVTTTAGTSDNSSLWFIVPVAGHEVDDIETIWLDGDEITAAQINWGTAAVTGGDYAGHVRLYRALGTDSQTVNTALNAALSGQWTTNHRLRGIAYILPELILSNQAVKDKVWDRGAPENIRAVVKGKKVYDPRLDSTFTGSWGTGSGSHRVATPSTWEWSECPALCWADYLLDSRVGRSVPSTAIDYDSVATAADICDATVAIPFAGSEPRYTCNGILLSTDGPAENLASILSSMLGTMAYVGGQFRVWAGAYVSPSETIVADDIVGNVAVSTMQPRSDRFNEVRARIVDPDREWQEVEAGIQIASTIRSDRDNGEVLIKEISLPMVNTDTQAQRISWKMLLQGDQRARAVVPTNWTGLRVATGDAISLTLSELGYSGKAFRCAGLAYDEERGVELQLREDSSAAWADPADTDYVVRAETGALTFSFPATLAPAGLAATGGSEEFLLTWTAAAAPLVDGYNVYASATSEWSGASLIGTTKSTSFRYAAAPDTTRYFWVRSTFAGLDSLRSPDSDTSTVSATARRIGYQDTEYSQGSLFDSLAAESVGASKTSLLNWDIAFGTNGSLDVESSSSSPFGATVCRSRGPVDLRSKRSVPFAPSAWYKVTAYLLQSTAFTGSCYFGVVAEEHDGALVDANGTATTFAGHYTTRQIADADIPTGVWTEFSGYINGDAATGATGASIGGSAPISHPTVMIDTTRRMRLVVRLDNGSSTAAEQLLFAGISIERVEAPFATASDDRISAVQDDLNNARVVTHSEPQWQTWRSDSSGTYPSGDPSVVLTARFFRDGTEIATQPVTFRLTSSSGVINRTTGTATGETTSVSTSGDGTAQVMVAVTHTASNQVAYLRALSVDEAVVVSGGGSISK